MTKERRDEAIEQGKEQIAKLMRKEGLPLKRLLSQETLTQAAEHFKLADITALYAAVGEGNVSAQAVVRRVVDMHGGNEGAQEDLAEAVKRAQANRKVARSRPSSEKPVGEWNTYEIICSGDTATLLVNGVLQNRATKIGASGGHIALQSEGAAIEFRNIRLTPLAK